MNKILGNWIERQSGKASIKEYISSSCIYDDLESIINYLNKGRMIMASPGVEKNCLKDDSSITGTGSTFTDGEWFWFDGIEYYLRNYHLGSASNKLFGIIVIN